MRGAGYAIAEIVWWMFTAGVVGAAIGWVVGRIRRENTNQDVENEALIVGLRTQVDELNTKLGVAKLGHKDCASLLASRNRKTLGSEIRSVSPPSRAVRTSVAASTFAATATPPEVPPDRETAIMQVAEIAARARGAHARVDDDLKLIHGVGPKLERLLKSMDITSFRQVSRFEPDDVAYVTAALDAFPGRIERDDWMSSAAEHHRAKYGATP